MVGATSAPKPWWLSATETTALDGTWDFQSRAPTVRGTSVPRPATCFASPTRSAPDPPEPGRGPWLATRHRRRGLDHPDGRRLPEPIRPDESPWHWLRARVICDTGRRPSAPRCGQLGLPRGLRQWPTQTEQVEGGCPVDGRERELRCTGSVPRGRELDPRPRAHQQVQMTRAVCPMPARMSTTCCSLASGVGRGVRSRGRQPPNSVAGDAGRWQAVGGAGLPHFAGDGVYRRTADLVGRGAPRPAPTELHRRDRGARQRQVSGRPRPGRPTSTTSPRRWCRARTSLRYGSPTRWGTSSWRPTPAPRRWCGRPAASKACRSYCAGWGAGRTISLVQAQ